MSHLMNSMRFCDSSRSSVVNIHSATSGLARLSTSWLRCSDLVRPAKWYTQSGCAR